MKPCQSLPYGTIVLYDNAANILLHEYKSTNTPASVLNSAMLKYHVV